MPGIERLFLICLLAWPSAGVAASLFGGQGESRAPLFDSRGAAPGLASRISPAAAEPAWGSLWRPALSTSRPSVPDVAVHAAPRGADSRNYVKEAKRLARAFAIPETLFLALIQQESAWDHNALSPVGAMGLAQLMPDTARELGVDPRDPFQNLHGGAKYLRAQYDTFGDWRLALAAYNAGPGTVRKYGGVPPYRETRNYVRRILGRQ